jgi:lipopolysaccharide/colanic/teichoic acid biosynthesis glycosyltransferase
MMTRPTAFLKRAMDILVAGVLLVLLAPLWITIAVVVRLTSGTPIIFRQERMGRHFQPFTMRKFRTMVQDAPRRGEQITFGRDPRITRVGRILRALKLDELPQLFNVLRGDMSLVGPRPEVREYVEMFRADYEVVLSVRPGVTDLASIKFRHEADILGRAADPKQEYINCVLPEKIRLAKEYIADVSIGRDLLIILKTAFALVTVTSKESVAEAASVADQRD